MIRSYLLFGGKNPKIDPKFRGSKNGKFFWRLPVKPNLKNVSFCKP
tara:strand:- start:196 stop:333 length:138 start_codon:yes stop_codon:yes gene_type:complete